MNESNFKSFYIKDAIYNEINIDDETINNLYHSFAFQRLRRISQLGGTEFIFPNAEHSRLSHSLGTYFIAYKILNNLKNKGISFSSIEKVALLSAALLHDIGHGPFSHTFEALHPVKKHEDYTVQIITNKDSEINQILYKTNKELPRMIEELLLNRYPKKWMNQIISSQLDADRLDYLIRDAKNSGVVYGIIQVDYLLLSVNVDNKNQNLVWQYKALSAIENYLIGRFHMYDVLYIHPRTIAFETLIKLLLLRVKKLLEEGKYQFLTNNIEPFQEIIKANREKDFIPLDKYLRMDSNYFNTIMVNLKNENDPILKKCVNFYLKCIDIEYMKLDNFDFDNFKAKMKKEDFVEDETFILITKKDKGYQKELYNIKDEILILKEDEIIPLSSCSKIIKQLSNIKTEREYGFWLEEKSRK